ncbi:unnamed protein product [Aphanomyces euteiches]
MLRWLLKSPLKNTPNRPKDAPLWPFSRGRPPNKRIQKLKSSRRATVFDDERGPLFPLLSGGIRCFFAQLPDPQSISAHVLWILDAMVCAHSPICTLDDAYLAFRGHGCVCPGLQPSRRGSSFCSSPSSEPRFKGQVPKSGEHYGGKAGEIIGGGFGSALGTGMSAMLGTVTGGNIYTKAARNGMGAGARIMGEYVGAECLSKAFGVVGRQVDKLTKSGRQAQAAAKTAKKERAEALKQPVLHNGGRYQNAVLSRTGSSPELPQRTGASPSGSKAPMNPGGSASTSGSHSPRNGGGASTSDTQLKLNLGLRKRKL